MNRHPLRAGFLALALALFVFACAPAALRAQEAPDHGDRAPAPAAAGDADTHAEGGHAGGHAEPTFVQVLITQTLGFLILFFVLYKFVVPPVKKVLADRSARIRTNYEETEKARAELARMTRECSERLAGLEREVEERVKQALTEGEAVRDQILAEARAHAQTVAQKAEAEIALAKETAIEEIRLAVIERTFAAAGKLALVAVTDPVQDRLVEDYLKEMEKVHLA
ncbi:MAG: F0F1 ATP synthase subunit B [Planctomycetes bacterium]|nr:F0F1 ATP synthase subunit B [Planctomycetota bacterium]